MPVVNGHQAECGCYVEGHWGQYGPDHLADQAEGFGWEPEHEEDDPRSWRRFVDEIEDSPLADGPDREAEAWERYFESADDIETWLNARTSNEDADGDQPGYVWHWRDDEFFLSPICENGDCNDDTCAHWD